MPAYSDTLGERQKCHCKRGVIVTTYARRQQQGHPHLRIQAVLAFQTAWGASSAFEQHETIWRWRRKPRRPSVSDG